MIEAFSLGSFVTNDLSDSSKDCNYVPVLWAVAVPTDVFLSQLQRPSYRFQPPGGRRTQESADRYSALCFTAI